MIKRFKRIKTERKKVNIKGENSIELQQRKLLEVNFL